VTHPVVSEELALLERVRARLVELSDDPGPAEAALVEDLERIREQILARPESRDAVALNEQWHRQSALLRQLRASRDAPRVDPRSPYFAHLRLRENGGERDLCLGRATCIQRGVRIVDWRNAPVSRIFYRYEQGEQYEEEFAGRVRVGEVLARRTVVIRDAVLERIESPEGVFTSSSGAPSSWRRSLRARPRLAGGEGAALRAHRSGAGSERRLGTDLLGSRRRLDKRLPEITSLIDPGQFDLITRPSSGFLVVRGAAGSGKTTVALHRIAYLAYHDPRVDSKLALFVAFSPALKRYVEHVLPDLGVERVAIRTFAEWAGSLRRRHFPGLPTETRGDTPALAQRVKLHPATERALAEQVRRVTGPATAEQAVDDWASVLTNAALLRECAEREAPGSLAAQELDRFAEWSRRHNEELFAWLAGDREVQAELDAEDDALLLRAWQLRVGPLGDGGRRPLRYRHVAVDEVQDFSPIEVRVLLGCLDEHRSITLAGDTQQHLMEGVGFTSWSGFLSHLGVPGTAIDTLRISHRSTREIVDFALAILGDLREDEQPPVATRSGPPVEVFHFTDRGACVAFLAEALRELARDEPLASVAVLTASPEQSALYHEGLDAGEVPRLRRVEDQDFTFAPGVEVTEIEQVKGLEFDYVIVVDVGREHFPDTAASRRLLHVASTRAVHQLWVTSVGAASPLLAGLGAQPVT
jgi:DNA helicase-2/ATP-dependent DNA helicase PcrA